MIVRRTIAGLGQGPTGTQVAGTVYGAGTSIAAPVAGGALATAAAIPAALAIPIVGAAFAGIWLGIQAILNSGCGQSCVITSNWANQAEALLKKNLAAYMALPTPRAQSAQQAYLANFDAVWNYLVQQCSSSPSLGTAGKNCIADRQAGGCHYHANGACWNWFVGYRDPIADDPNVAPDSAASVVTGSVAGAASSIGVSPWLLAGAALLVIGLGVAAS